MPSVSVSRVVPASAEEVWAVISDVENARRWNATWSRIEVTSAQTHGTGTTFRAYTQDGQAFDFEVSRWVAPEYIEFTPVREADEHWNITLESQAFRLTPAGDEGTHVELIARARGHGPKGRVLAMLVWPGYQRHGLETALDALLALFLPPAEEKPSIDEEPAAD